MNCNCGYPVTLVPPSWADTDELVSVDVCIAKVIHALWTHNIWTLASCCGKRPSVVLAKDADIEKAKLIIKSFDDREWEITQ
jgi:hypothetical protein